VRHEGLVPAAWPKARKPDRAPFKRTYSLPDVGLIGLSVSLGLGVFAPGTPGFPFRAQPAKRPQGRTEIRAQTSAIRKTAPALHLL
jgi:hypothetical protein